MIRSTTVFSVNAHLYSFCFLVVKTFDRKEAL